MLSILCQNVKCSLNFLGKYNLLHDKAQDYKVPFTYSLFDLSVGPLNFVKFNLHTAT